MREPKEQAFWIGLTIGLTIGLLIGSVLGVVFSAALMRLMSAD